MVFHFSIDFFNVPNLVFSLDHQTERKGGIHNHFHKISLAKMGPSNASRIGAGKYFHCPLTLPPRISFVHLWTILGQPNWQKHPAKH
jgi:hypothetical protein